MANGDGYIHKIPSRGGPDLSTIPDPAAILHPANNPGIGALDYDPDENVLWATTYQPININPITGLGDCEIYKLDAGSGAILKTFSHPLSNNGLGWDGLDTLAIAHPADLGGKKVLLTDYAGKYTSGGPILYALDPESGAILKTYPTSLGPNDALTGVDEDPANGDLIFTGGGGYANLGPAPYNRAIQPNQILSSYNNGISDIALKEMACDKATITPPQSHTAGAFGWSMNVEVSSNEGVVLTDVKLNERYMAERVSVPYYNIDTTAYQGRGELKPASSDPNLRSRLVGYSEKTDSDEFVIEAVYSIDNIPAGSNSCLTIRQRYEFHKEGRGCEPTSRLPCSRFKPIVKYEFIGRGGETLISLSINERHHFLVNENTGNSIGLFRDCDNGECIVLSAGGFRSFANPLENEHLANIIKSGQDVGRWDSIHETFKYDVEEPKPEGISLPDLSLIISPGCPECVHNHWRWGVFLHGEGNGNLIGIPAGSTQDVDFAIVKYYSSSSEVHPENFRTLAGSEPIRHGRSPLISSKPLVGLLYPFKSLTDPVEILDRLRRLFTDPDDVVIWYSATGHEDADSFFTHGFFFNPSYSNASAPTTSGASGSSNIAIASLSEDGPVNVTFAELYQSGATTFTDIDPDSVAALPSGYTALNGAGYDIESDAVVSGLRTLTFATPSVNDQTAFNNLRILHLEHDPFEPAIAIWVDRTILSPDAPAPDFASRTISARIMGLGKFVVAELTDPQPPNTAAADLAITSSHTPSGPIIAGNDLTYTLTVTNNGPQTATSVTFADGLDPNAELISITLSQGSGAEAHGSVVCTLGSLAPGANATVTIVVKPIKSIVAWPASGDNVGNIAYVAAREIDNNFANNSVNDVVLVLPDSNMAPAVSITSPTTGASFTDPATVTLTATASDTDGTIDKVEFYDNDNLIGAGTASGNTYSVTWNNAPSGSHALVAVAQDNGGKMTLSKRVNIIINARFTVAFVSLQITHYFLHSRTSH